VLPNERAPLGDVVGELPLTRVPKVRSLLGGEVFDAAQAVRRPVAVDDAAVAKDPTDHVAGDLRVVVDLTAVFEEERPGDVLGGAR